MLQESQFLVVRIELLKYHKPLFLYLLEWTLISPDILFAFYSIYVDIHLWYEMILKWCAVPSHQHNPMKINILWKWNYVWWLFHQTNSLKLFKKKTTKAEKKWTHKEATNSKDQLPFLCFKSKDTIQKNVKEDSKCPYWQRSPVSNFFRLCICSTKYEQLINTQS